MWCTECRTAFSWKRGTIVTGVVHNPHYFEYMRRRNNGLIPRQPGDTPEDQGGCQQRLRNYRMLERLIGTPGSTTDFQTELNKHLLIEITRQIIHIREVETHRLREPGEGVLLNLRRKFLMKSISQDEWKRQLLITERKKERVVAMRQVYDVLINASQDIVLSATPSLESLTKCLEELQELFEFVSGSLEKVCKRFNCTSLYKIPDIDSMRAISKVKTERLFADMEQLEIQRKRREQERSFVDLVNEYEYDY